LLEKLVYEVNTRASSACVRLAVPNGHSYRQSP